MSYLPSVLAFGYMVGSLVTSVISYFNRQVVIAIAVFLQSITLGVMPHCVYVSGLFAVAFIYGFGGGIFDSSFNLFIMDMHPTNSEPVLQVFIYKFVYYSSFI